MRGGYRAGGGRPKGSTDKKPRKAPANEEQAKIRQMLAMGTKVRARMYQEFLQRVGRGETLSVTEKKMMEKIGTELAMEIGAAALLPLPAGERLDPLEYGLRIMNDPNESKDRRDRLAIALLPYLHERRGERMGKKDEKQDRAKAAGAGKFASMANRLKVVK